MQIQYSLCVVSRFVSINAVHSAAESGLRKGPWGACCSEWLFCGRDPAAQLSTDADGLNYFHLNVCRDTEGSEKGGSGSKG